MTSITMHSGTIKRQLINFSLHKVVERIAPALDNIECINAAKVIESYFTSKSDCQIEISSEILVLDGGVSFHINLADLIKAIRNLKGWIPSWDHHKDWFYRIKGNTIVQVFHSYVSDLNPYTFKVVSTDPEDVELFEALNTLEQAILEGSEGKTEIMI